MQKNTWVLITAAVVVYGLTAFSSYFIFSRRSTVIAYKPPVTGSQTGSKFDETLPKTEPCPLNGAFYSTQQKDWWQKHRPLGVMIENHEDARPQSGLSSADVVYEAVAEGAITRFLSVFYCQDAPYVGPVRSARTYFLDFISEYSDYPLYAHVGGANSEGPANALGQIVDYGWNLYNDLSEFSIGCPVYCRDVTRLGHEAATEHTMYSSTQKLWDYAAKNRNLTNVDKDGNAWDKKFVPYSFKDDVDVSLRPFSQNIHVEFWKDYKQYAVDWSYDKTTNTYKRANGGKPHIDRNTNKQLSTKNIIIMYMQQNNADDGYENNVHLIYKDKGTGKATIFMDGKQTSGTWKKDSRAGRTLLFDQNGNSIKFDRGTLWFQILPTSEGVLTVS